MKLKSSERGPPCLRLRLQMKIKTQNIFVRFDFVREKTRMARIQSVLRCCPINIIEFLFLIFEIATLNSSFSLDHPGKTFLKI